MTTSFRLCSLHENVQYTDDVVHLLNDEWPQSRTIRMRRLERSSDKFPTSFILLDENQSLIGYAYVDRLFNEEKSLLLESLCIKRSLRGKGLGREFLRLLEEKVRRNDEPIETIFLTTTDKRDFYARCGYEVTSPRVRLNVSSQLFQGNESLLKNFLAQQNQSISSDCQTILQKGSTIQRISTVWMKKNLLN